MANDEDNKARYYAASRRADALGVKTASEKADSEKTISEQAEKEAKNRFELQWARELLPKVRAFLRGKGVKEVDLEDYSQETGFRLWRALRKPRPHDTIGNLQAYAKRVAFSVLAEHLNRKLKQQPNKRRLLHAFLDALNAGEVFAVWEQRGERWCGLASWNAEEAPTSARMDAFQAGQYDDFIRLRLGNHAAQEFVKDDLSRLPVLLAHLFAWIGIPLPVTELVFHVAQLLNVADLPDLPLDAPDARHSLDVAQGLNPLSAAVTQLGADPFTREYLKQFGEFVCKADLTRCERGATVLALTRHMIVGLLCIPMTALAAALDYSPHVPERFQTFRLTIWQRLPRTESDVSLTDEEIATLLEIVSTPKTPARQMVANCRSTARNRKWPLWLRSIGWNE